MATIFGESFTIDYHISTGIIKYFDHNNIILYDATENISIYYWQDLLIKLVISNGWNDIRQIKKQSIPFPYSFVINLVQNNCIPFIDDLGEEYWMIDAIELLHRKIDGSV